MVSRAASRIKSNSIKCLQQTHHKHLNAVPSKQFPRYRFTKRYKCENLKHIVISLPRLGSYSINIEAIVYACMVLAPNELCLRSILCYPDF